MMGSTSTTDAILRVTDKMGLHRRVRYGRVVEAAKQRGLDRVPSALMFRAVMFTMIDFSDADGVIRRKQQIIAHDTEVDMRSVRQVIEVAEQLGLVVEQDAPRTSDPLFRHDDHGYKIYRILWLELAGYCDDPGANSWYQRAVTEADDHPTAPPDEYPTDGETDAGSVPGCSDDDENHAGNQHNHAGDSPACSGGATGQPAQACGQPAQATGQPAQFAYKERARGPVFPFNSPSPPTPPEGEEGELRSGGEGEGWFGQEEKPDRSQSSGPADEIPWDQVIDGRTVEQWAGSIWSHYPANPNDRRRDSSRQRDMAAIAEVIVFESGISSGDGGARPDELLAVAKRTKSRVQSGELRAPLMPEFYFQPAKRTDAGSASQPGYFTMVESVREARAKLEREERTHQRALVRTREDLELYASEQSAVDMALRNMTPAKLKEIKREALDAAGQFARDRYGDVAPVGDGPGTSALRKLMHAHLQREAIAEVAQCG